MPRPLQQFNFIALLVCELLWFKDFWILTGPDVFGPQLKNQIFLKYPVFSQSEKTAFSFWIKKNQMNGLMIEPILGFFGPPSTFPFNRQKSGSVTFLTLWLWKFMPKNEKNKKIDEPICERTDGRKERQTDEQSRIQKAHPLAWVSKN